MPLKAFRPSQWRTLTKILSRSLFLLFTLFLLNQSGIGGCGSEPSGIGEPQGGVAGSGGILGGSGGGTAGSGGISSGGSGGGAGGGTAGSGGISSGGSGGGSGGSAGGDGSLASRSIAAGYAHSCIITTSGTVKCWGYNGYGQLGNNTTTNSSSPVTVLDGGSSLAGATAIATGYHHTCALITGGTVKCWGYNGYGQLGNNTYTDSLTPVTVLDGGSSLTGVTAIAVGNMYSCALMTGGTVKCWGSNGFGQLGNNTTTDSTSPVTVLDGGSSLTGVTAIATSYGHTCALITGGTVKCWGYNAYGQLGNNMTANSRTPVSVLDGGSSLIGATAIDTGYYHTCALMAGGTVKCWGYNASGQLGNNTMISSRTPVSVLDGGSSMTGAMAIFTGYTHTCALMTGATVKCWGDNSYGQLGNNTTISARTPVSVLNGGSSLAGVTAIAVGDNHNCALIAGGEVKCWGNNNLGQTGQPGINYSRPVSVAALTGIALTFPPPIDSGYLHACALTGSGTVKCWGDNEYNQLGNNTTIDSYTPTAVLDGASSLTGATAIAAGAYHNCALIAGGEVKCWGYNPYGELGDNTTVGAPLPVLVLDGSSSLTGATAIDAGYYDTCALMTGGIIKCWGYNSYGQLGNNTTTDSTSPVTVLDGLSSLTGATAIAMDYYHSCALMTGGIIKCWGYNSYGQLGNNTTTDSTSPVTVLDGLSSLAGATAIATGYGHTCALMTGGTVKCWGSNNYGQLGNNTNTDSLMPVTVLDGASSLTGVTAIATGYSHTCALMTGGSVKCWGYNDYGQLGNNTIISSLTPVTVLDGGSVLTGVTAIATGDNDTCALMTGGTVKCWGDNYSGQLGNGEISIILVPQTVAGL